MTLSLSQAEIDILNTIDPLEGNMIARVKAWSAINSGSYNQEGLSVMRAVLKPALAHLPGKVSEVSLPPSTDIDSHGEAVETAYQPSLLLTVRPDAPVQIVLTGHYDTVFPAGCDFQTPEVLDADTLRGPGVADMKGGIIVMLTALTQFETSGNAGNIGYRVLLSADEEIGSPGSASILSQLGASSHIGLTYEPSLPDGSLAGARKGSGIFAMTVRGKSAHAGREPHLGRNAIAALSGFISKLDALNGQREGVTLNISKVDGGGPTNVVPELAIGRFNVRVNTEEDMAWVRSHLDVFAADLNAKDGISAELSGHFHRPPKPMSPANAQVFDWVKRAGGLLGMDIRWSDSGGVCEGNNLWASGCPNVDTLGVIGGNIHSDQEYVKLSSFTQRAKLSTLILLKIASGEFDARQAKALVKNGDVTC